jgi:hypothetical protein
MKTTKVIGYWLLAYSAMKAGFLMLLSFFLAFR